MLQETNGRTTKTIFTSLINILYPRICVVCKDKLDNTLTPDKVLCIKCYSKIKRNLPPFCCQCGRHLTAQNFAKNICSDCIKKPLSFDRAFSPCIYEGVIKELLHQFKYNNKDYLGYTLSKFMINFIADNKLPVNYLDLIIPIPLHRSRLREREFNQAQILGDYIARNFNKAISSNLLLRHCQTKSQTGLNTNERFLNVKDTFSLNPRTSLRGKNIMLVDDVLTTGATSSEAARLLKKAGANIVFVLTLAN